MLFQLLQLLLLLLLLLFLCWCCCCFCCCSCCSCCCFCSVVVVFVAVASSAVVAAAVVAVVVAKAVVVALLLLFLLLLLPFSLKFRKKKLLGGCKMIPAEPTGNISWVVLDHEAKPRKTKCVSNFFFSFKNTTLENVNYFKRKQDLLWT